MVQIDDTLISLDVFEKQFLCDLNECKGICCIEGDSGAPVLENEVAVMEDALPVIWDDLSEKAKELINKQGVVYTDEEGDLVTSIIDGRECVFTYFDEKGICKCAFEKAFNEGKIDFQKPISCHLYPIRLTRYKSFTAVNYHSWNVCKCARICGEANNLPVYKFLKEPLIRCFGEDWYAQVEEAAKLIEQEKNKR